MSPQTGQKVQGLIYCVLDDALHILGRKRAPAEGGFWKPLTGTVEDGESYEDCLIRELYEETGITQFDIVSITGPIHTFTWTRDTVEYHEAIYAVCIKPATAITLSDEHDESEWLNPVVARERFKFEDIKAGIERLEHGSQMV